MSKKYTTEEFIEKAKKIHGNRYDYSLVEYLGAEKKVRIICPEHGIFIQNAHNHLLGKKCIKCYGKQKISNNEFIEKAKKIHGNRYDYSLVEYLGAESKIKIVCPKHEIFEQIAYMHLKTNGCLKCLGLYNYSTKEFIKKAKKIHDNKYDYSLVEYSGAKTKIRIICLEHGIFEQIASNHISGNGCPRCCGNIKNTNNEFIEKAEKIHDGKYDYSLTEYLGAEKKVRIICPKHGIFKQTPSKHYMQGCPYCNESKGEKNIAKYLRENNIVFERQKIFINCKNKYPLPFDFYLPDYNICIEYDGEQHFKVVDFFGGVYGLEYRKNNDEIKNKYCLDNNIVLIRIKYNEKILYEKLLNLQKKTLK